VDEGVEFSGKTVEEAIAAAEEHFGVERDALDVEVLSQGSRGVFGLGAENARVHARMASEVGDEPEAEEEGFLADEDEELGGKGEAPAPTALESAALAEEAQSVLQELLRSMGFDASVSIRETETPIMLAITGDNLGVLIGRRGDNLAALQFMLNLLLSKNRRQWPRIVIDVENYRARREDSLRTLADRLAYRVRRNGRPFTLEAMPASDRRVIHLALRDRPDVETYSIGEGPARRVVIAPKQRVRT
jgi:spoIIIJ-associated protein